MKRSLVLGISGALLLLVGVFLPVVKVAFIGSVNLINNGKGVAGLILAAVAVISIVLVAARIDERSLWAAGSVALGTIAFALSRMVVGISQLNSEFSKEFADNPFRGLGELALDSIQLQWGWVPLTIGAIALLGAPRRTDSMGSTKVSGLAVVALVVGTVVGVIWARTDRPEASPPAPGIDFPQGRDRQAAVEEAQKLLKVESVSLVYNAESGQTGENYHDLYIVVKNTSDKAALDVTGQISLTKGGRLLKTLDTGYANILPGARALLTDTSVELPEPAPDAEVRVQFTDARFRPGSKDPQVSFKDVAFSRDKYGFCSIQGVMSNKFSGAAGDVQVNAAGYEGDKIVTGGFTYVTTLPGQDATFEITSVECPGKVDRVEMFAGLNQEQIFGS